MEETKEIAVMNFLAMVESGDRDTAIKYLSKNGWDESRAVEEFFSHRTASKPVYQSPYDPSTFEAPPTEYKYQNLAEDPGMQYEQYEESSSGGILSTISSIFSFFIPKKWKGYDPGGEEFLHLFEDALPKLPHPKFLMGTYENAVNKASVEKKPLLFYIHNNKEIERIRSFIENTISNPEAIKLIDEHFLFFGVDAGTKEGKRTMNFLGVHKTPYIATRIALRNLVPHSLFNIDDLAIKKEAFVEAVLESSVNYPAICEQFEGVSSLYPTYYQPPKQTLTKAQEDRILKEIQEQELKEAQKKDEEMKKKEIDEKFRSVIEKEKQQAAEEEKKKQKLLKIKSIPPEPSAEDPGVCEVAFRLPSGQRVTRRFLKTTRVEILFNFIYSLQEENIGDRPIELSQPMPKRIYGNKEATLEEEGLFPKALVQVVLLE